MWTEMIFFKKHLSLQHGIIIYSATMLTIMRYSPMSFWDEFISNSFKSEIKAEKNALELKSNI